MRFALFAFVCLVSFSAHAGCAGGAAPAGGAGYGGGASGKAAGNYYSPPPIQQSNYVGKVANSAQGFNASAQRAAANPLDAEARAALQTQLNQVAADYRGLQDDAASGRYDTSQMDGVLRKLADKVGDVKTTTYNESSRVNNNVLVDQRSLRIEAAPKGHALSTSGAETAPASRAASSDSSVASIEEQIMPSGRFRAASVSGAGLAAQNTDRPVAEAVSVSALASERAAQTENAATAPVSGVEAASSPEREVSLDTPALAPNALSGTKAALVDKGAKAETAAPSGAASEPLIPDSLRQALRPGVKRVQGGAEEGKEDGVFSALTKPGKKTRSLASVASPVLAEEDEGPSLAWWTEVQMPAFFTSLFMAIVIWQRKRDRRALAAVSARETGAAKLQRDA